MEKRTVIAVVLSMLVIFGFYMVQGILSPPKEPAGAPVTAPQVPGPSQDPVPVSGAPVQPAVPVLPEESISTGTAEIPEEYIAADPGIAAPVIIETNLIKVVLSNAGGDIVSYQLKEHEDKGLPVEMVLGGDAEPHAFGIAFGSREDILAGRTRQTDSNFQVKRISEYVVEFSRDFYMGPQANGSGGQFTLTKRYEFKPNEYLFELTINLDGGYSFSNFNFQGAAYTLIFGPQIGPWFEKLDQRSEFRQYLTYNKNKVRQEKINTQAKEVPAWTAIVGKYFALIAIPNINQFDVFFSDQKEPGLVSASRLLLTRPAYNGSRLEDKYYFYLGPKKQEILDTYYNGKNNFTPPLHGFQLADAAKTRTFLSIPPLENLLKWILMFIHRAVPNYGVAIILLTILVKLLMFPLTRKGSESTLRMQALSPKIKEIQDKYKDNPQKMNVEMAELYKKEGYNPLSGCLPMIIQMPIFFAMYNLFNNHFDLRGAMFIPGWIPDLSLPESVFNFAPFRIPLLGWSDIRLLPFLYVGSQLLYGKVTQTPDQKGNTQMKMMLYVMPVVFFFILYDVPSGLLLYWIMSNVLTMVQQIIINKYLAKKKAAEPIPEPVIAPKKKKKK